MIIFQRFGNDAAIKAKAFFAKTDEEGVATDAIVTIHVRKGQKGLRAITIWLQPFLFGIMREK